MEQREVAPTDVFFNGAGAKFWMQIADVLNTNQNNKTGSRLKIVPFGLVAWGGYLSGCKHEAMPLDLLVSLDLHLAGS